MFLGAFAFITVFSVMPMGTKNQINPISGVAQVGSLLPTFFPVQQIDSSAQTLQNISQQITETKNPININNNSSSSNSTNNSQSNSSNENTDDRPEILVGEGSYYASPASVGCPQTDYSLEQNPNTAGYRNIEALSQVYVNGKGECVFDANLYVPPSMVSFVDNVVWTVDDVPLEAFTSSLSGSIKNGLSHVEITSDYTLLCVDFDLVFNQSNSQHGRECRSFTNEAPTQS